MELEYLSAIELGNAVNNKELSPVESIEYFAGRIEARNPSINAFVYTKFDEAIEEAKEQEKLLMQGEEIGPLAGVPIALKDFLPNKKGWQSSHGGVKSMITTDEEDDIFYATAKKLGAIAIGKTNAPSFGFRGTTDNKMYGPTSTPFKVGYNSGGSSGGSAAAVADGLVPIATAGDAGGSTRIPAAWCGCFGFKPSAGVVPSVCRPDAWTATHPYCCGGYETQTVLDNALLMNHAQGYDPRDPLSVHPTKDFCMATRRTIEDLRIGYTFNFDLFPDPDEQIVDGIDSVAYDILRPHVKEISPVRFNFKHSLEAIESAWLLGISIDSGIEFTLDKLRTGHDFLEEHAEDLPEEFIHWTRLAQKADMIDYYMFHEIRTDILDAHLKVFEDYDIIIAPVAGCLPVENATDFNTKGPDTISGIEINPLIGFGYTYLENMIGYPAASVPIGLSKEGLPIGLQVIGRRYEDENVFRVARLLEYANPWKDYYKIAYTRDF